MTADDPSLHTVDEESAAAPQEAGPAAGSTLETALEKLEAKRRDYDALYDKYLRLVAEFENHKKRTAKDWDQYLQFANDELLKEWLPVADNIERALRHAEESKAPAAVVEGWALILKQCQEVLGRTGVTAIDSVGRPFNPELHQAIAQREVNDAEDGMILEEAQRGYLMKGRLLRPALVTVAKRSDEKS
jgi:molecular chaperone GrpE